MLSSKFFLKLNALINKTVTNLNECKQVRTAPISSQERKERSFKIASDCRQYISSKKLTKELQEHVEALKSQDNTLTTLETIVTLLDFTEREFLAIEKMEKNEVNFMARFKSPQGFFNIFR